MMKRRLAYIVLSIVLAFSAFSLFSCGDDEIDFDSLEDLDDDTRAKVSLNFFVITDERTTDEAKEKMQAAFNEVSEVKLKTHVEFIMCTAPEYAKMMEERFAAIENGEVEFPGEIDTSQDAEGGQSSVSDTFPEVEDGQIDIVLVTGKQMLQDYVDKGRLMNLTEKLDGDFKTIRSYINTELYNNVALDGSWYAVPNNKVLGNYTYLFINKQIAADSYFNEVDFSMTYGAYHRTAWNFNNIQKLLDATMKKNELYAANPKDERVQGYEPLIPLYSAFNFPTVEFWMEDGGNSIYSTFYDANTKHGDYVTVINPFDTDPAKNDDYLVAQSYVDYLELMLDNQTVGYDQIPAGSKGKFAVAVMEGDYGLRHEYEDDYMVMLLDNPRLEEDDMFASMLAVSSYTRSSDRALELISELTTDKELRNILLYGEEGTHYVLQDEQLENDKKVTTVKRLNNEYMMSTDYTGNAFMAYPCSSDGQSVSIWDEGMIQNNEALRSPTYGFSTQNMWETLENSLIDFQVICLMRPLLDGKDYQPGAGITDLEEYIAALELLYLEQIYPDLANVVISGGTPSEEAMNLAQSQISAIVGARVDDLRVQATAIAKGVVSDAKTYSAKYIERIESCTNVEELNDAIAEICDEIDSLPLFINDNNNNGTPFGLYEKQFYSRSPKFTLAGALLNWRLDIVNQ